MVNQNRVRWSYRCRA